MEGVTVDKTMKVIINPQINRFRDGETIATYVRRVLREEMPGAVPLRIEASVECIDATTHGGPPLTVFGAETVTVTVILP